MVQDHFHGWDTTCKCWVVTQRWCEKTWQTYIYLHQGGGKIKFKKYCTCINQWALTKTEKKMVYGNSKWHGITQRMWLSIMVVAVVVVVIEFVTVVSGSGSRSTCRHSTTWPQKNVTWRLINLINSLLAMPPSGSPQPKPAAMCSAGNCTTWNGFQTSGSCQSHWWSCAQGLFYQ